MIDWLSTVAETLNLQNHTLYNAVSILDVYLSLREVAVDSLKLCATTCLFIAAKSNESDTNIPSSLDLHKHMVGADEAIASEYDCSSPMITACERQILNDLKWNLD